MASADFEEQCDSINLCPFKKVTDTSKEVFRQCYHHTNNRCAFPLKQHLGVAVRKHAGYLHYS